MKDSIELSFSEGIEIYYANGDHQSNQLFRPYILDGKYLYGIIRHKPYDILVCFDIEKKEHMYEIELTDVDIKSDGVTSFYVHSTDSIFFQSSNSAKIILIDSLGEIIIKRETTSDHTFVFPSFLPMHIGSYDKVSKNFYSTLIPVNYFTTTDESFDDHSFQGIFRLDSNNLFEKYGALEGVMKVKEKSFYPPDLSIPYNLILDGKAYVNYPMDHFIYVYTLKSGELINKIASSGRVKVDLPEPLPEKFMGSRQDIWNFRISASFYEPLFFHSKVRLFTRAMHLPQSLKLSNGKLNTGESRQTVVMIFNEKLETVGQAIFNNGEYSIHGAIPLPDGILLQSYGNSANSLYYRKFSLKLMQ